MVHRCVACGGTGCLWMGDGGAELCPVCEGNPGWPTSEDAGSHEIFANAPDVQPVPEESARFSAQNLTAAPSVPEDPPRESNPADLVNPADSQPESEELGGANPLETSWAELQEDHAHGRVLFLSGGFFRLAVMVPANPRPNLTETDVAKICTTWTHGGNEERRMLGDKSVTYTEMIEALQQQEVKCLRDIMSHWSNLEKAISGDANETAGDTCGICMEPFNEGDEIAALPCATRGCGSVWHFPCIHKWLNQGRTPSCPLCRAQIDCGSECAPAAPPTFALIGNDTNRGGASSEFSQDLVSFLFRAMLSQQLASSEHSISSDGAAESTEPRVVEVGQDNEITAARMPIEALA